MSTVYDTAKAVHEFLLFIANGGFEPIFRLVPLEKLEALQDRVLAIVAPRGSESTAINRGGYENTDVVDIYLTRRAATDEDVKVSLAELERIRLELFKTTLRLDDGEQAMLVSAEMTTVYDAEILSSKRVYAGLLSLRYKRMSVQ